MKDSKDPKFRPWMIRKMRWISRSWGQKEIAKVKARESSGSYKCAHCEKEFPRADIEMNHKQPVIDPNAGFMDWDTYIERLFVDFSMYEALCKACHKKFTNKCRALTRKKKSKSASKKKTTKKKTTK